MLPSGSGFETAILATEFQKKSHLSRLRRKCPSRKIEPAPFDFTQIFI